VRDFLHAIWGDLDGRFGEIRSIKGGVVRSSFHSSPETAESDAMVLNSLGHDVYYGVLPRNEEIGRGSAISDVTDVMWADFDGKAYPGGKGQAFAALAQIAPQAQIVVDSGHGFHAYWLLDGLEPFEEVREVMKGMTVLAGADRTHDKARILRVPGTHNHKTDPAVPVRILRFDTMARRHRLSDFIDYAEAGSPPPPERTAQAWGPGEDYEGRGWETSSEKAPKFGPGERNNGMTRLAGIMFARGMSPEEVLEAAWSENLVRCDPPLDQHEVEQIVRSVGRYHR
jgi:hypothetical protein